MGSLFQAHLSMSFNTCSGFIFTALTVRVPVKRVFSVEAAVKKPIYAPNVAASTLIIA